MTVALLLSLSPFFSFSIWKYLFHWLIYFYCRKQFTLKVVGNSFPNSDRLISHHTKQISLPYPFPPPPPHPCEKMSDWISRFHSHVHSDCHATFTISNFNLLIKAWVRIVGLRREKVGFEGFECTCSWWELKKTVFSFLKNLNSRGKIVLIMNQLNIANCSKVHLNYFIYIKFWTI